MQRKKNKFICILIALFVFIFGMYFGENKIDSLFSYSLQKDMDTYFISADCMIEDHACTAQMLGIRGNLEIGQSIRTIANQKKEIKFYFGFLLFIILSFHKRKFDAHFEKLIPASNCHHKFVTNYIHRSDGKKRI